MTAASDVRTTLASLRSAQASLELFALQTQSSEAKEIYTECAQSAQSIIDRIAGRLRTMENEEPQYRLP